MNRPASSKFVPALPSDDDIDTQTNSASSNSAKIYDGVAECTMNDADTIKNVKIRAKDLAQEKLLNKVADCVDGFLRDRLLTFPDDEIFSIANEIYHITDVKYNTFDSDDNLIIRATVLAQVDDNDIMNCLVRFFKERIELKHQIEDLKRQIADLKQQLANNQQNNTQVTKKTTNVNSSNSKEKSDEAFRLFTLGKFKDAIKLYDELIQCYPNVSGYYFYRSRCYTSIGDFKKAQDDLDKYKRLS